MYHRRNSAHVQSSQQCSSVDRKQHVRGVWCHAATKQGHDTPRSTLNSGRRGCAAELIECAGADGAKTEQQLSGYMVLTSNLHTWPHGVCTCMPSISLQSGAHATACPPP